MHNSVGMAIIESFQELEKIIPNIIVSKSWIKDFEIGIIHVLKNERWGFRLWITDNIQKLNDILSAGEILQDLNFTLNFLLLHRFQDFNYTFRVIINIESCENLTILSPPNLANNFVILLIPETELNTQLLPNTAPHTPNQSPNYRNLSNPEDDAH